jgi:hypothetical protein
MERFSYWMAQNSPGRCHPKQQLDKRPTFVGKEMILPDDRVPLYAG